MIDKSKTVLLLGSNGTIGQYLKNLLDRDGYNYKVSTRNDTDLLNGEDMSLLFQSVRPSYVINLAAKKTNISLNNTQPVDIYTDTVQMALNVFKVCRVYKIEKLIQIVSSCAYGHDNSYPLYEEYFDSSPVHPSISPHGNAKRQLYYLAQYYHKQYQLNTTTLCFNNIYGGSDFSKSNQLKVVDALVKKFVDAKRENFKEVEIFGTGKPLRELLFYKDAAEGILQALEKYDDVSLLNIGNGYEISIKELAIMIKQLVGYEGKIKFNTEYSDGQMRKLLDNEKMKEHLNWRPPTSLEDGLVEIIESYKKGKI